MAAALLIPVKETGRGMKRLSPLLSPAEREALALLLLHGVMEAAAELPHHTRRLVVTSSPAVAGLAAERGFEVLREERQISESDSVDRAGALLEREGVTGLLRVPLDLPLISGDELTALLEAALAEEGRRAVLAPSLDGTGTNALYRSPPTLFPSAFGPGSLAKHERMALDSGAATAVIRLPGIAIDLDEPEDLAQLVRQGTECPALDYLREIGIEERMGALPPNL